MTVLSELRDTFQLSLQEPYEVLVPEDTPVGSTVFSDIQVEDSDLIGDVLEITCEDLPQVRTSTVYVIPW